MKTASPMAWRVSAGGNHLPPLLRRGAEDVLYFEQVKALRAKIESKVDLLHVKVVAVTSSIAGEGKTLSCANLAANLSSAGMKKVLLMDVDLRKSDLSRGMGVAQHPGLSDFLAGTAEPKDILRESIEPGLRIIPAGTRLSDPTDLLAGEKFKRFLIDAREEYDVVLLDTPPILPVADTLMLKDQVDGFVFLFRAGFTPHNIMSQALEEVGEQKVLGVVLNGVEAKSPKYYHRYYGKYYSKT
jgi:capsular exopolysaccharide synthesis family protein